MTAGRWARAAAVAIAVLGVIDPASATSRRRPSTVAVLDTMRFGAAGTLADDVARALARDHRVVRERAADAAAVVVVGDRLPPHAATLTDPSFVVVPGDAGPALVVARVDAPRRASVDSRVPVRAVVEAVGADGRKVEIRLRRDGIVLDRMERTVAGARAFVDAQLTFVSGTTGVATLQVEATIDGEASARADVGVDVGRDRARVLFHDGRPSWFSTFVRRTLEHDRRFDVFYRTRTSRGIATTTEGAPAALRLEALDDYQVIAVGAPEALSRSDLAELEAFARRRGGSLVLLLDADPGSTLASMLGVDRWQLVTLADPERIAVAGISEGSVQSSELVWPSALPPRARVLARATAQQQPVLFEVPLGAGRVLVSGLADMWRYRSATAESDFASLWPLLISGAADAAFPRIDVAVEPAVVAPGADVDVTVALRDLLLAPAVAHAQVAITATLTDDGAGTSIPVRLWPDGAPGMFRGSIRAPAVTGDQRLRVAADGAHADVPLALVPGARQPLADQRDLLAAWATTRGGRVFQADELDGMREAITAALPDTRATVQSYWMRSPWWIVPFALALGFEWRSRRRQGRR